LQLEQTRQQLGVIDFPAVGRAAITTRTGVDADAPTVVVGESREREIVQVDETMEETPGWVDLDREPPFSEVDLDLVRALPQAVTDLGFVLVEQILDELLSGVSGNLLG